MSNVGESSHIRDKRNTNCDKVGSAVNIHVKEEIVPRLTRSTASKINATSIAPAITFNQTYQNESSHLSMKRKSTTTLQHSAKRKKTTNSETSCEFKTDQTQSVCNVEIAETQSIDIVQNIAVVNNDETAVSVLQVIDFSVGEVVWAKIKGYAHWPAKIKSFPTSRTAEVVWFNDYRTTKIFRTQLFKYLINFEKFSERFNDTVGLKKAAHEGLIYYGQTMNH